MAPSASQNFRVLIMVGWPGQHAYMHAFGGPQASDSARGGPPPLSPSCLPVLQSQLQLQACSTKVKENMERTAQISIFFPEELTSRSGRISRLELVVLLAVAQGSNATAPLYL